MTPNRPYDPDDSRRMMIAMLLMGLGLLVWHFVYEYPRQQEAHKQSIENAMKEEAKLAKLKVQVAEESARAEAVAANLPSLVIDAPEMQGKILLQGARFNTLSLTQYKQEPKKDSPPVELLKPSGAPNAHFVEFGWIAQDAGVVVPDGSTLWQVEGNDKLTHKTPVTLFWESEQKLRFEIKITLKDDYLFEVKQRVVNHGDKPVTLLPYGFINRSLLDHDTASMVSHEGPIGVMDGSLTEVSYKKLIEEQKSVHENATGWLGISDKYWLTALIPQGGKFTGNFKAYQGKSDAAHRYQADFMGGAVKIAPGTSGSYETLLFAGAKKLKMLDDYAVKYHIPLFDRAVDLGFFYFLTKPLFALLHFLYKIAGDFGLAILLLTVVVKLAMYPLANKSFVSMNEMKRLQPKMQQLKERHGDDKMKFQQGMMQLYKEEKINPASGCFPMLIQMPVFFALYKVLYVTIEMRHANFFGIIHDLSAQDPTNVFTGFGLLDWNPPSLLTLGIMPILFAISMMAQQRMNPKPTDPAQAKAMQFLPWIFMFVMAHFPAGLLLYWIWSNMLSILQQWSIKHRYGKREKRREASAANDA